jgi:hypothetical protein
MLPTHEPKIPERFAQRLLGLLGPLCIIHKDQAENDAELQKLRELLVKISHDAYNLILLLRSCKDTYTCEFPEPGKPFNIEEAEAVDSERVHGKGPKEENAEDVVVFALSGALVRYPEHNLQERIVLQKAWAVVEG